MAHTKVSAESNVETALSGEELFYVVDDPGGTPVSGAITYNNMLGSIPTSIISDTDSTDSLGSTTKKWLAAFLDTLVLGEQASAPADVAGDGQLWVKNATPNELWFTDDAGTDFKVSGMEKKTGTIWSPNSLYGDDHEVMIFRTDAAITIRRIHIAGPDASPGAELDIDLKWADDTTSWTNAAVIDVCDTSSGVVTITSGFDDADVASGKYIYWSFGAQPHADWLWFWFEIYYTYD